MRLTGRRHAALILTIGGAAALLTACGSSVPSVTANGTTSAMPSVATSTTTATATAATQTTPADTTTAAAPARSSAAAPVSAPTGGSKTTAACQSHYKNDRVVNVNTVAGTGAAPYAIVLATTFTCAEGEGYYSATGTPYKLAFAASARVMLSDDYNNPAHLAPATLALLEQMVQSQAMVGGKWNWFGGTFGVNLDSAGHITEIDEYYHP